MNTTSLSLLERLREAPDPQDWEHFVWLYTPLLDRWARQAGAQDVDVPDLIQDLFTLVYQKIPQFAHQRPGSFRAWMRVSLLNRWRDACRRRVLHPELLDSRRLDELPAVDSEPEDREDCRQLVARALELIRQDFQPQTWEAFWESFHSGQEAAVVARRLGVSVDVVYAARCRVLRRLRQELGGVLD
jgi:RNA polymerase sigma-70 factor (ECF subfamily)